MKQGKIQGNPDSIFKNLAQKYNATIQTTKEGKIFFNSGNIRVGMHNSTKTGIPTLDIDKTIRESRKSVTKRYKIRVNP